MTTLYKRKTGAAGTALGAFMLVWLSMMLQPCLMAQDMAPDHDCPHCPTQSLEQPCHVDEEPACTYIDGYDYDGRTPHSAFADAPHEAPVLIDELPDLARQLLPDEWRTCSDPGALTSSRPPLNILNCVFII